MKTVEIPKAQVVIGWVLSSLVIAFLLFDASLKFFKPPVVVEVTVGQLGYAEHHILILGLLPLVATLLYALPVTAVLGAVLLTGHLGGAIASHLRVDNPLFSHTLFPVYV